MLTTVRYGGSIERGNLEVSTGLQGLSPLDKISILPHPPVRTGTNFPIAEVLPRLRLADPHLTGARFSHFTGTGLLHD